MIRKIGIVVMILFSMPLFSEPRNALLIANGKYLNLGSLATPIEEARNLKKTLERLDFKVMIVENANLEKMQESVDDFGELLKKQGGIGFFHYGGHAVQVNGSNYLIPSDADIPDERRIRTLALDVDEIMANMQAETNIVILDACRNNPLPAASGRSATRGLVLTENRPKNSIIVYSADAGRVAKDGVFTPILTKKLLEKKELLSVLREVRLSVRKKTGGEVPEWVRLVAGGAIKEVRKILHIPDTDKEFVFIHNSVDGKDMELQVEFNAIYEINAAVKRAVKKAAQAQAQDISKNGSYSETYFSAVTLGNEFAQVAIMTKGSFDSNGNESLHQELITPSGNFPVREDEKFLLTQTGLSWLRLAFQEGYPNISRSFKKVTL